MLLVGEQEGHLISKNECCANSVFSFRIESNIGQLFEISNRIE